MAICFSKLSNNHPDDTNPVTIHLTVEVLQEVGNSLATWMNVNGVQNHLTHCTISWALIAPDCRATSLPPLNKTKVGMLRIAY